MLLAWLVATHPPDRLSTHSFEFPQAALIGGLGGERTRWQEAAAALGRAQVRGGARCCGWIPIVWSPPDGVEGSGSYPSAAVPGCKGACMHQLVSSAGEFTHNNPHTQDCLLGDMLVAAATIAYLGAFTAPWRSKLVAGALALCSEQVRPDRACLTKIQPAVCYLTTPHTQHHQAA